MKEKELVRRAPCAFAYGALSQQLDGPVMTSSSSCKRWARRRTAVRLSSENVPSVREEDEGPSKPKPIVSVASEGLQPTERVGSRKQVVQFLRILTHPALWRERVKVVVMCFIAFVITNVDRVNISVVMMPLSRYYDWSPVTVGLIQSAFFWGYLLTQIPGGYFADRYGGKVVFAFGVLTWSTMTMLFPYLVDRSLTLTLISRGLLGVGEGVILPAMSQMVSKWIRVTERSRSLGFIYSGIYLGSIFGLAASPNLTMSIGWYYVFYIFGSLGLIWSVLWIALVGATPKTSKFISKQELRYIAAGVEESGTALGEGIPWKNLFTSRPFWALMISHFCLTWGYFVLLTWTPTYFNSKLGFDMTSSAFLAIIPWASMFINANLSGFLADFAVSRGVSTNTVRKGMQTIGFLGPAVCLGLQTVTSNPALCVVLLAMATGLGSFCQAGVYSNHQDIGPSISGVLLGITNTAAAIPGIVGVFVTGLILDTYPNAWNLVFYITIAFYILGTLIFNNFATTERLF
eukprot:CAMPEP_0113956880 /NCGR_PEP_ID=MMETSP0011_2-20120614/2352_1 /TAXON_ID=101924 /ORGANISM="Rhodosorus marinus" /LENGTH=516 /DNA_ID=CAMNT_0000967165 /DNA_START=248 /DNA_END=1798 /DNA_ORIENTATION=+ /assembly_acc=CAM_ASM_000156